LKKALVLILILIVAGAYYYFQWYQRKSVDSWQLVPSSAVLAFEHRNLIESWNTVSDGSIWKTLEEIPLFARWTDALYGADSLSGKDGALYRLFRDRRFIASAHVVSSNQFDFLFNLELFDQGGSDVFERLINDLAVSSGWISSSRTYQGFELNELTPKPEGTTFTYLVYEHVVVGSFTAFLVEDVVRNVAGGFQDTFQAEIAALGGVARLKNDEGDLYIDYSKLPRLFSTLTQDQTTDEWQKLAYFTGDSYLDVKITDEVMLLNGVTTVDLSDAGSYVGTFRNQEPGQVKLTARIPNSTAILYHVSLSDFSEWQNQLTRYWAVANPQHLQRYLDFKQKYGFTHNWLSGEVAHAIIETPTRPEPDQLVFAAVTDGKEASDALQLVASKLAEEQGDTVYYEVFDDLQIVQLPIAEFPAMAFGTYFSGFQNSFVAILDDCMVVGNSMQAVKSYITDLEDENTWGKSVRQSVFLEGTLSEASFSMMINTRRCWKMLVDRLNDQWVSIFEDNARAIQSFDLISLQVSNLDRRFYTSIAIGHKENAVRSSLSGRFHKEYSVYTPSPISTKPFIVRNHNNSKFEVLVQDSARVLYQVSDEGEVLWGDSLQSEIVSDIFQIDYYKNNKLQYLFATPRQLHLLDRNGDYVEQYPIVLPEGVEVQFLSVIDYDNSKKYRLMVADQSGNLFLFDQSGAVLEGWGPRRLEGSLASAALHVRVRGGDCIIALQKDGMLNVMNRRGKMYPGFPVDLKVEDVSNIFVNIGNDFATTGLITISGEGELVEVNLKGKVLQRKQLYKPSKDSKFWLVSDALGKTFIIVRQEYNRVSFLDSNGVLIFESELISSGVLSAQYYNFSPERQVFVLLDEEQEFVYLYDAEGNLFAFEPLECGFPIGLLYSSRNNLYQLYKCYNNNIALETFQ
jgi:hypothetical protein